MGASAAGNAYKLKLDEGWTADQARSYAMLVGASESTLQYLLGGISALSGGGNAIGDKLLSKALNRIAKLDNGFMKTAANFGARLAVSGFGEGIEEGLQEVLEPLFATMITGQDYDVDWGDVGYSFLMGFLSSAVFEGPGALWAARSSTALDIPRFSSTGMDSYLGASGVDYFAGCQSAGDVKTRYRELAREHHPDAGGSQDVMAEINRQRTIREAFYTGTQKAAETAQRAAETGTGTDTTQGPEAAQRAREAAAAPETETFSDTMRTQTERQSETAPRETAVNENGLTALTELERTNLSSGVRNKIVSTFQEAVSFIRNALTNRQSNARAYMGKIPDSVAARVLADTGVDIQGYNAVLPSNAVRHIFKNHGDVSTEASRGQVAVTEEAIARIPEVLTSPDAVTKSQRTDNLGRPALIFQKKIGDMYVTIQAISDGTHSIQTDTLYIQKERPTDTVYNTGNVADPVPYVQNAPPSGLSADSVSQQETVVNSEAETFSEAAELPRLTLPTVEGTQAQIGQDAGGISWPPREAELPRLILPTVDGAGTPQNIRNGGNGSGQFTEAQSPGRGGAGLQPSQGAERGKGPNRSPAERVRFGKEEERSGRISGGQPDGAERSFFRRAVPDGRGQRPAGLGTGGPAGRVGGGPETRGAVSRLTQIQAANQRQNTARNLRLEKVGSRTLGLSRGTDTPSVTPMPLDTWDAEQQETGRRVKRATGKNVMYVLGRIPVRRNDGSVTHVRGVDMERGGIIIQADHKKLSVEQIGDHEIYHELEKQDPSLNRIAMEQVREQHGPEEVDRMLDRYIESMDGLIDLPENATPEQVEAFFDAVRGEFLADVYSGIDAYGVQASKYRDTVRGVIEDRKLLDDGQNAAATDRTTGPPESDKYSIETLPDGEQITVIDQGQDAFIGQPKSRYPAIAKRILLDKFRGQTLPLSQNDLARFKTRQAGEYVYAGAQYDENSPEFEAKMRSAAELDHLLETAEYSHWMRDKKNHKEATLGFDYYTVKFIVGGHLFEGLVNIANSENGRIFYDITKVKEISDTRGKYATLMVRSSSAFGDLSTDSISQVDQKSNDKFSLDDDVDRYAEASYYEETDKGVSDEYAQYQEKGPTRRKRKQADVTEEIPQSAAEYAELERRRQAELPRLRLPAVEGTQAQTGHVVNRAPETFSEAVMRQLTGGTPQNIPRPDADVAVAPEGLSLPIPDGTEIQTEQVFNNGLEELSLPMLGKIRAGMTFEDWKG